jgi:hypothetical protein
MKGYETTVIINEYFKQPSRDLNEQSIQTVENQIFFAEVRATQLKRRLLEALHAHPWETTNPKP